MRLTLFLTVAAGLAGCTQPNPGNTISEADLQGSCEALVSAETGVRPEDISAISTQTEPTGSITSLSVVGAEAPWLCRADPFGVINGVEYSQEG